MVSGGWDRTVRVWELDGGITRRILQVGTPNRAIDLHNLMVAGHNNGLTAIRL